ncbi:MAG TPA: hypothetical protein VL984_07860 [Acidimicrobiales bacterium]|nr:hypothetical protein [Acidimicrobiales bacterium]
MAILGLPILPTSITASAANELLKVLLTWEMSLTEALVKDVMSALAEATAVTPAKGNGWFGTVAHEMYPVEVLVMAPLLFAATISAIFHQDMRRLARAWAVGLPLSMIGGFAAANAGLSGLQLTNVLSTLIQKNTAPHLGSDFVTAVALGANSGAAGPVGALFSLVVLAGGVAIWLELALRSAAIELAIFFMPLAFAALVWPSTTYLAKRLVQLLVALLLAKPIIVGALCLGDNALTSSSASASSFVTGSAILLMAAFSPMALLKLVPVIEVSAISHLQGLARQPLSIAERNVQRAFGHVRSARDKASQSQPAEPELAPSVARQVVSQMGAAASGAASSADHPLGPARFPNER